MFLSHEQFTTTLRRVPWGAWFEGGSEDNSGTDTSGTDPNAVDSGSTDTSSTDTFGGGDPSTDTSGGSVDTSGGGGSTDTSGGGGATYDPFGGISDTGVISGGNTGTSNGTGGWFDTNSDPSAYTGADQFNPSGTGFNDAGTLNDTNPDYGTGVPFDQWTPSQQIAYFNSPNYSNISQAGLFWNTQQPGVVNGQPGQPGAGAGGAGTNLYYNPQTGAMSNVAGPGMVALVRDPVTGALKPAPNGAPGTPTGAGGTVPIMNTTYEVAKLTAATDAARLAYDYWHTYSGNDALALAKAQLAAQSAYQQGQLANQQAQTGLDALKLGSSLQADPFRQQQVMWGIGQNPYLSNAIGGIAGQYDLPKFQAPTGSAADTATLSGLASRIGGSGGGTPGDMQAAINALPNPNQVVARNFVGLDPTTQQYLLSGLQAKTGLDTNTIQSEIQGTLPQFKSPSFGLADV